MKSQEHLNQQVLQEQQLVTRLQRAASQVKTAEKERIWAIVTAHTLGLSIRNIARAIGLSSSRVHQLLHTDEAKQIVGLQVFNRTDDNIKQQSPQSEMSEKALQRRLSDDQVYILNWGLEGLKKLDRGEPVLLNLRPKHSKVHHSFTRAEILGILEQVTKNSDRLSSNSTGNEGWCVLSGMVLAARRNLQRMA